MPGIARKIIICAAIDGLILQPLSTKGQRPFQPVRIGYGDASISAVPRDQIPDASASNSSFEAFGIIGLITVSRLSYLITITRRQQVAQVFGFPIYLVTGVAITPCNTKQEADESIHTTASLLKEHAPSDGNEGSGSSDEDGGHPWPPLDEVEDAISEDRAPTDSSRSSVMEDIMRRRGSYGRFAQRWFSSIGWTIDQRRSLGLSIAATSVPTTPEASSGPAAFKIPLEEDMGSQSHVTALLPKLLRTMQVFFGSSRSFYFSYDLDLTRSISQHAWIPNPDTPLHTQVDSKFFWNRHLLSEFMATGQDSISLPLMQGFIGQRTFVVDSDPPQMDESAFESVELADMSISASLPASPPSGRDGDQADLRPSARKCLITLVSRRSTQRAGLRYLRRGINEDGFAANMVETEQIISSPTWDRSSPIHSFVQIRGSIPLFFTQSAYSLKPVPVIQHSPESNYRACRRHFERLLSNYGSLQIVNLVEKRGVEEPIGAQYEANISRLNEELGEKNRIPFEWFDFHHACRGMKFENVSQLLAKLRGRLGELGSTTQVGDEITRRQSSFAKHMLDLQLKADGIDMSAQPDQETRWFNTLWADNGDAVSKQYASTAAMKGDYTRTRKRDYRGALNDLGLSLARFYSGMVNDYFSQAAMDFLLGTATEKVFDEFESDMMTKDPAISVAKLRQHAVELCQKRVVADINEEIHGGWVLISPNMADVVRSWSMEEVVVLLTDAALYVCRFDWHLDKVSSFERVHLANVTHIKFGTYITSTLVSTHMDEVKNVGLVVSYQPGKSNIKRTNTRTLSTKGYIAPNSASQGEAKTQMGLASFFLPKEKSPATRRLAFKAPYVDSRTAVSGTGGAQQTELQQVVTICAEIERLAPEAQLRKKGGGDGNFVEKGDIISLQEAKKNTGLLEQLGHSIKRLVWA
ncbi:SacI domain protein [Metarhizium album ARSEF 1941]|uniref:SacI domain protein n=1 Tax=Metarhizium album (strain ARSEF 1941) TaxID=1081103 RepID=A0A0B2WJE5_METAS|nr:SacI domain protein [Metarhizium album ARSEF 1941]KHN93789.1 SacI domain protein [Metarhizium album ARSEF 1941]